MPRSGRIGSPTAGRDHWTLAFAIVMLLLFSLFLSLYSLSKRESAKLRDEIERVRNDKPKPAAKDVTVETASAPAGAADVGAPNADLQTAILAEAKAFLSTDAKGRSAKDRSIVEVLDLAGGDFLVRVAAPDLFVPGSSKVTQSVRPFVDRLGALIVKSGRRLRIEGHADFDDSEAIARKASAYTNTWELSGARAAALAQYWMRKFDLDPTKIEAAGYGKYRPLEAKTGRPSQANRRIEIVILRMEKE